MRIVLFCKTRYAFSILQPLQDECEARACEVLWYVHSQRDLDTLPSFVSMSRVTSDIAELERFRPDAIFVPGNSVPYYLRGVKTQVFHGFAGEKAGHFRIRQYFDLYLTQGPYFTERFEKFRQRYRNFEVVETGWPRFDRLFNHSIDRQSFLSRYGINDERRTFLYAPTHSPRMCSFKYVLPELTTLTERFDAHIFVKLHPLARPGQAKAAEELAATHPQIHFITVEDLLDCLLAVDLLVSDTSSAIYEALLLEIPVVTLRTKNSRPSWHNVKNVAQLPGAIENALDASVQSNTIFERYHPYKDGRSSARALDAVAAYIERHGVPDTRQVNPYRRWRIHRSFGRARLATASGIRNS